ncbi:MAG: phage portal protein [bacterium]
MSKRENIIKRGIRKAILAAANISLEDLVRELRDGDSAAGKAVTVDTAMQIATVNTCVRIISQTVASLPLHIYKRIDSGGRERWPAHPLYRLLNSRPNIWQTSMEWREQMVALLLLKGNYYGAKLQHGDFIIDDIIPLDPDRMQVEQLPDYSLKYTYSRKDGSLKVFLQDEILHIRGLSTDGVKGRSVISDARELFGSSLAASEYGGKLLRNDATPGLTLETPNKLSDAAYKRLKEDWDAQHAGSSKAGKTAILEEGLKATKISMTADEAQFLQTIQAQRSQIAGWFGVPLILLSFNENTQTYASAEQFMLSFVQHTIRPWLVRIEQSFSNQLFSAPETYYPEFNIDGLLRGDLKTRYEAYAKGIGWGFLSPNEAREKENMNARPDGDKFLEPTNMRPAGTASQEEI